MNIIEIAQIINNNGGRLYYVGGCVRDRLMNLPSNDIDCCLVGMTAEKFINLFHKFSPFCFSDYTCAKQAKGKIIQIIYIIPN